MNYIKYPSAAEVDKAVAEKEPLLVLISFDGKTAIMSHIDEAVEHHILLEKTGFDSRDIDKYFRIVLDEESADWTFICPPDYKGIALRERRITQFYKDGFAAISSFLADMGMLSDIRIPRRYRRHLTAMGE